MCTSGLHVVDTLGNFYQMDKNTRKSENLAEISSSMHFWPMITMSFHDQKKECASVDDVRISRNITQYWGAFVSFDNRVRRTDGRYTKIKLDPGTFQKCVHNSFQALATRRNRKVDTNYYFVNAWNEWNEQAVLEPSDKHRFEFLKAVKQLLLNVPASDPFVV